MVLSRGVTIAIVDPRSRSLGYDIFMTTLRADIYGALRIFHAGSYCILQQTP